MIKIKNNFLKPDEFKDIQQVLSSEYFPWYFNDYKVTGDNKFQFVHRFYDQREGGNLSSATEHLLPIFRTIGMRALIRAKSNLNIIDSKQTRDTFHCDYKEKGLMTAIFYINTNNGKTVFKNGEEVDCVENRLVIFPCQMEHTGKMQSDTKRRIVLNINYYPLEDEKRKNK
tara:strand:+ start:592 stop:1104 length:513 start_codon:yes stop_codon:yes gene_type:complete